jgi:tetratricopeptide (TPR) repeat protein
LLLLATGCSTAPKTTDAYGSTLPAKSPSWTDTLTAPFKSNPGPTADAHPDEISLSTGTPKPHADLIVSAAKVYEKSNNNEAAAAEYEKALKLEPNYLPAILGYAHFRDRLGQMPEATKLYARAEKVRPQEPATHNDLGICYARQGMLNEAAAELQKAVKLQPGKKLYRNNLAQLLVEQDKYADAYNNLVFVHGEAIAHYNLGYLMKQKGSIKLAQDQFALALRVNPSLTPAQQMLDQLAADAGQSPNRQASAEQSPAPSSISNIRAEFDSPANNNAAATAQSPWPAVDVGPNIEASGPASAPSAASDSAYPAITPANHRNFSAASTSDLPPTPEQVDSYPSFVRR